MFFALSLLVCVLTPSLIEACGRKPFGARIVGGEEAPRHSWPWQVSLRVHGSHICGASLVNQDWVVSAAHCVDRSSDPNRYSLLLGAHSRTGEDGEVVRVSRVIKHPGFSMSHLRHDVAVLKLSRPATIGGKIGTICLPSHGSRVSQRATCYVTGWGRIDPKDNFKLAPRLKQASAPVASHRQCQRTNGNSVHESSMLCVGGRGSSVCNGDSGGPLSCNEGANRWRRCWRRWRWRWRLPRRVSNIVVPAIPESLRKPVFLPKMQKDLQKMLVTEVSNTKEEVSLKPCMR
ncbi:hypothetical protein ACROYT_G029743 [Oculina patagonica]